MLRSSPQKPSERRKLMPRAASKAARTTEKGLVIERRFSTAGVHPYEELEWETRDAIIGDPERPAFEQRGAEFPTSWSQNATNIVAEVLPRAARLPRA
jgi:ribonucleoside-diphosphate reductase alpha chain